MRAAYTTGQAAAICGLGLQTIIRAVDRGDLLGFSMPGSNHRRIPAGNLGHWMERHGIPVPDEMLDPAR